MEMPIIGFVAGAIVQPERVNSRTGEAIPASGRIDLLVEERGSLVLQSVKCSPAFAERFRAARLQQDQPAKAVKVLSEVNMYDFMGNDGRQVRGISIKAIEDK